MKKRVLAVLVCLVVMVLIAGGGYLSSVKQYQNKVHAMEITEVDLSQIPDGTYRGSCDVNFIVVTVEVTVDARKIERIDLTEHKNERGKAAERITGDMVCEQKIDVDSVSGATNSSTVIKKAVENALREAVK